MTATIPAVSSVYDATAASQAEASASSTAAKGQGGASAAGSAGKGAGGGSGGKSAQASGASASGGTSAELTTEEQQEVTRLSQTDQRVHAHEQAHIAAGGNLVIGGANYSYRNGPDGKRYAVSGEVNIDTSPVQDDPKATITKAQRIQRAALAPADPSAQDRAVAASAAKMAADAAMELSRQSSVGSSVDVRY